VEDTAKPIEPPSTTPDYMHGAWASCLSWAVSEPEIVERYRIETGDNWNSARAPIEKMIDKATGADRLWAGRFVDWFNKNIWGDC